MEISRSLFARRLAFRNIFLTEMPARTREANKRERGDLSQTMGHIRDCEIAGGKREDVECVCEHSGFRPQGAQALESPANSLTTVRIIVSVNGSRRRNPGRVGRRNFTASLF